MPRSPTCPVFPYILLVDGGSRICNQIIISDSHGRDVDAPAVTLETGTCCCPSETRKGPVEPEKPQTNFPFVSPLPTIRAPDTEPPVSRYRTCTYTRAGWLPPRQIAGDCPRTTAGDCPRTTSLQHIHKRPAYTPGHSQLCVCRRPCCHLIKLTFYRPACEDSQQVEQAIAAD